MSGNRQPATGNRGFVPRHFGWDILDRVGTITLERPERKNPLTFESYAELRELFERLCFAPDVRAVIITGSGGNFSSGGDVHDIIGPLVALKEKNDYDGLLRFTQMTGDVVKAMRRCPQPIIAAIDGICAGAGAILAMASDFRIGTAQSRVAFLFTKVGLSGADMGACAMLPRIIGLGRAAELLYTGRWMSAEEAERWGFYNRIVVADEMIADVAKLAKSLADGPTAAHAATKACLHREWSMGLDEAIDHEAREQARLMLGGDFGRAYHAFVAKQTPRFEGS
jgi:enoyl-CoA hydratase/carnithine racemase